MAKKPQKYVSGWQGHIELDGQPFAMMGWSSNDTVDEVDLTTDEDLGWTLTEQGCRSVSITFSIPNRKDSTTSPLDVGGIYACLFTVNEVPKYDGDFIVTACNITNTIRGASIYEVVVKNYGNVLP